jgi:hypothetical protein
MTLFDDLVGKKILNIQRLDSDVKYEFYSPYAIIFTFDNQPKKLIISATNDGSSVDVRMTSDEQIEDDYGLEFSEHILNDLKKDDELCSFIGDKLLDIRIAEYILPEMKGSNFIIRQGKYAGVELKTEGHKLLFQNNYGGWCNIDDGVVELTNKDRWKWE